MINVFFEYGKLRSIPAQRRKEHIVLEVIADFRDDLRTIRRGMAAEGLMGRDAKGYRRIEA